MAINLNLLKEVLSVPTVSRHEGIMVEYLINYLTNKGYDFYIDERMNIYVTKQTSENVEYFPCVVAHTDTVHSLTNINVREEMLENAQGELKLSLKAYDDKGEPTGIGGDDKAGVFACLTLLDELPDLKAAFFVSEEIGCVGSTHADPAFFQNVGYAIQFDAPENWMVTEYCFGERLFNRDSEFFKSCDVVLKESMTDDLQYQRHPFTDVYALRKKFDFSCINLSIGYYDYHSRYEYVVVDDVENGIKIGKKIIESVGNNYYHMVRQDNKTNQFLLF